jgi:hypothetical protein
VAEDLPLVLMQQQQQGEAVPAASGSSNAAANANAAAALPAAKVAEQAQQVQQQQQQQPEQEVQQVKRRRLSDTSSSSSSVTATVLDAAPFQQTAVTNAAASPSRDDQQADQQQQQVGRKHKHGPAVEGCSYKGNLLDASLLLPTPVGWVPGFLHSDTDRVWRGGRIAPFGANLVLVLYGKEGEENKHSSSSSSGGDGRVSLQDYRVRLVYNEQVLPMPGCSSSSSGSSGLDCSLQEFLDVVVGDKISYERFKLLCDGEIAAEGWPTLGGPSSDDVHSDLSSSSSSSSSNSGSFGGLSVVGFQESLEGLQLETADGLPLLLPAASGDGVAAVWDR